MGRYLCHTRPPSGPQGGLELCDLGGITGWGFENAATTRKKKIPIITITARRDFTKASREKLMGNADGVALLLGHPLLELIGSVENGYLPGEPQSWGRDHEVAAMVSPWTRGLSPAPSLCGWGLQELDGGQDWRYHLPLPSDFMVINS